MALDLVRHGAYCKREHRWVRAHHGGARRREHVRGRGAAIVGTSGDLPSAASEKGRKKVPKPRGNSVRPAVQGVQSIDRFSWRDPKKRKSLTKLVTLAAKLPLARE